MKLDTLIQTLNEGEAEIKFVKANGDIRILNGTRNLDLIPLEDHPLGTGNRKTDAVVSVYDLDAYGWRSFHKDSVISCTVKFS